MRSDLMKEGASRAPHRSLLKALGITDREMKRPFVAVVSSKSDYIPGHAHLDTITKAVEAGIRNAGGVPFTFNTIGASSGMPGLFITSSAFRTSSSVWPPSSHAIP